MLLGYATESCSMRCRACRSPCCIGDTNYFRIQDRRNRSNYERAPDGGFQ